MAQDTRGKRKKQVGVVVSGKMDKTVVVQIERLVKHQTYGKYIRRHAKLMAHDEKNECKMGDKVMVIECRPISKRKRWRVSKKLEEAGVA